MPERLTASELACVRCAGEGLTDKEIARRQNIGHRTVQRHLANAYRKLEVTDRHAAFASICRDYAALPIPIALLDEARRTRPVPGSPPGVETGDSRPWLARVWRPPPHNRLVILSLILGWAIVALALMAGAVSVTHTVFATLQDFGRAVHQE